MKSPLQITLAFVAMLASPDELRAKTENSYVPEEIRLQGVTVLPVDQVSTVLDRYTGQPLDFGELQRLRVELSQLYADAGYVNSGVVVPDQTLSEVLVLQAVEGELSRVEVVGNTRLRSTYLKKRFTQRNTGVLNIESLQSTLRWLQDDPNIERIDAELLPGTEPGGSVLRLSIDDPKRFSFSIGTDNYRAASLGAEALAVVLESQNITGYGEKTQLAFSTSEGSDAFSFRVDTPINARNSHLGVYYRQSDAQIIEQRFEQLDIESQVETLGLALWHPVFDSSRQTMALTLGVEKNVSESSLFGVPFSFSPGAQDGKSATATLEAGLEFSVRKQRSATALRLSYRRGFYAFGATRQPDFVGAASVLNPTGADGKFGRFRIQASVTRQFLESSGKFGGGAQVVAKVNAQLAEDPLLSLEKLSVGGRHTVRGFRENSFVRDSGVMVSTELVWPLFGVVGRAQGRNLSVVPFADYGWSWDKENVNPGDTDSTRKGRIGSVGIGLRWLPIRGLRTEFYWGESIDDSRRATERADTDYDLQDDGLHFLLSYTRAF